MMVLRSVQKKDLSSIYRLASNCGLGLTTLPADKSLLQKRLEWAIDSFEKEIENPNGEYYLFVLENTQSGQVVGTSAIEASIGHEVPFYSYKLSQKTRVSHDLNIRVDYDILSLVNDLQHTSEICTLFLHPKYRVNGNGTLLSRSRFLFIADKPKRFSSTIIAEMRGVINDNGQSPFWNAIGAHFFKLSFAEADRLTISTNKQFISDLMPRNPIYLSLIDPAAQKIIGKPNESTKPAMNILLNEGFVYDNYVDIFDGGPTLKTKTENIQTIKNSMVLKVENLNDSIKGQRYMVANGQLDFRAIISHIVFNLEDRSCTLRKTDADALRVKTGDSVRVAPLNKRD